MSNEFDWDKYEAPAESASFDWDKYAEPNEPPTPPELGAMEKFYRASGIHGANRAFSNMFGFGPHAENTQKSYEEAMKTHPAATNIGYGVAEAASALPFLAGGMAAAPGLLGATIGAGAYGAQKTPAQGENRLDNALKDMLITTGLGAAGAGLSKGSDTLKKIPYSKAKIAKNINESFNGLKAKYTGLYDSVFETAEKEGLKTGLNPVRNFKKATEGMGADVRKMVKKAYLSNDPKAVHEAQSKLAEFIRFERKSLKPDKEAISRAFVERHKLTKALDKTLSKSKEGLSARYKDISSGYKKEVVPYSMNKEIKLFNEGARTEKDFIKALQGNSKSAKEYRKFLADAHPDVKYNKYLDLIIKGGLGSGIITGGGLLGGIGSKAGQGIYNYVAE